MLIADEIRRKFSVTAPVFFATDTETIKLERKPYLQPFENELAMRELRALLDPEDEVREEFGLHVVRTAKPEEYLRQHLTYWQRVGRIHLEPTVQKSLEFTQNGVTKTNERRELHNARRLRYGPHDLHEYRGKFFPQLVRSLINISRVASDALVLDPMCGSGTTPCEAIADGRSAIGADLNPLSVLIATVKASLPAVIPAEFVATTTDYLEKFTFDCVLPEKIWDKDDLHYLARWFDHVAINDLAAVIAEIRGIRRPLYRDFFKVCLSNILRSVSWQKSSDLRVRKEVQQYDPGTAIARFTEEATKQIDRIYPYLCVLPRPTASSILDIRHGNAVDIAALFPEYVGKADVLITSPPYATALPYLDTDRLSLIVLGLLSRKRHKDAEASMIGSREVSERQRRETWDAYTHRRHELPSKITKLIDEIASHNHGEGIGFRRRNLPALLGRYFLDMLDSLRSAHTMMRGGAHAYYVVGNNSTIVDGDKVEIPTDRFLFEIGAAAGWTCDELIGMELLASRDIFRENRGSAETILCFSARPTATIRKAIYTHEDEELLTKNGHDWNFHDCKTQEHVHSLHPFPAKFIPQIPRRAIELWSKRGDIVYDPFAGCGTTLLEASLLGRNAVGTDNNPIAILLCNAKTATYRQADLNALRRFAAIVEQGLTSAPRRTDLIPTNKDFHYWFAPAILDRLAKLKGLILSEKERIRTMLMAVFSSIVVRVSYQDSDTRYARTNREVRPKDVDKVFLARLLDVIERLPEVMVPNRGTVTIHASDARNVPFIKTGSVTLIVTSPPYLNAYDYHKYHRQRIHWIGGSIEFARDLEIGGHDEFTRPNATPDNYFQDMDKCFGEWSRVLKKKGHCLIVIGDAIVSKQPVQVADSFITLLANHGLSEKQRWIRTLHSTKRAFNVKNSRISHEHVLLLQKR